MFNELSPIERNAEQLVETLIGLGMLDIGIPRLEMMIKRQQASFEHGYWTMHNNEKLKVQVHFQKGDDGDYSVSHYHLTFAPNMPVNHAVINGIDTKVLEEKMKTADWYYAYSESAKEIENEYEKIESIESDIQQLIKSPEGLHKATILWNNNVPFYTATKPDLIRQYENNGDLYIKEKFSGNTHIAIAYENLVKTLPSKLQQEVNDKFEELELRLFPGVSGSHIMVSAKEYEIIADDPASIRELIQQEMLDGKLWVAFDDGKPVIHNHDLNFFEKDFDVAEFCHENQTDRDLFMSMSISDFENELTKWEKIRSNPEDLLQVLESKMKHADWNYKEAENFDKFHHGEKGIGQINYLLLMIKNDSGIEKAQALWDKYVPENTVVKPNLLTDKNTAMITEQELSQNRREFGLIGASEAFNDDLIKQMKAGVPKIEHKYPTKNAVTGDEANTVFHLNKSDKGNLYFLNKWDVTAKKFGAEEPVKMTFYMNDLKRIGHVLKNPDKLVTTFTHARSINYLSGRPVLNTYKNQNDRIKKVWDQAYPNEKLPNGKMKERSFHEEYGFDLRKVGSEYRRSVTNLANPEYTERFYQSLERGNFEKAKFVEKDGKENHYYVTPNISVGFFDVYAECSKMAKPLTPEQQAEKGFISQEFALKVRERMTEIAKDKQTHKQNKVAENSSQDSRETVKEQKQGQSQGKRNKPKEKMSGETGIPKKKVKHKHT